MVHECHSTDVIRGEIGAIQRPLSTHNAVDLPQNRLSTRAMLVLALDDSMEQCVAREARASMQFTTFAVGRQIMSHDGTRPWASSVMTSLMM